MKSLLSIFLIVVFILACDTNKSLNDDDPVLIGFLNNVEGVLYHLEGEKEDVIYNLEGEFSETGQYTFNKKMYEIKSEVSDDLENEVEEYLRSVTLYDGIIDTSVQWQEYPAQKIRKHLKCDLLINGSQSKCKRTYGRHINYGSFMYRVTRAYRACRRVKNSICKENYSQIGEFIYFNNKDCMSLDSNVVFTPIYRFTCN